MVCRYRWPSIQECSHVMEPLCLSLCMHMSGSMPTSYLTAIQDGVAYPVVSEVHFLERTIRPVGGQGTTSPVPE